MGTRDNFFYDDKLVANFCKQQHRNGTVEARHSQRRVNIFLPQFLLFSDNSVIKQGTQGRDNESLLKN